MLKSFRICVVSHTQHGAMRAFADAGSAMEWAQEYEELMTDDESPLFWRPTDFGHQSENPGGGEWVAKWVTYTQS